MKIFLLLGSVQEYQTTKSVEVLAAKQTEYPQKIIAKNMENYSICRTEIKKYGINEKPYS